MKLRRLFPAGVVSPSRWATTPNGDRDGVAPRTPSRRAASRPYRTLRACDRRLAIRSTSSLSRCPTVSSIAAEFAQGRDQHRVAFGVSPSRAAAKNAIGSRSVAAPTNWLKHPAECCAKTPYPPPNAPAWIAPRQPDGPTSSSRHRAHRPPQPQPTGLAPQGQHKPPRTSVRGE